MKIALFPSAFHPSLGGVEELSLRLAQAWQETGHNVRVYTERWPRDLPEKEIHEGVQVRRYPFRVRDASGLKPKLTWAAAWRGTNKALQTDLREFKPDVIHVQCVSSAVDYALPAARALGVPFVVTLQGELSMDANGIYQRPGGAQRRMFRALDKSDAITACSKQTLDEAQDFYVERGGEPFGDRGRVIYNGIDLKAFKDVEPHRHNKPYIFALGRHVHQKGFDVLLRAMAQVPDSHDLILAGDGPDRGSLEALAAELGLADRVVFRGRIEAALVRQYMKGADLFVLPSRHEPFGIVNLEAMASGTPVVATRVGGVPEFVDHEVNGILVEPGHVEALSDAISDALSSDHTADRADAALISAKSFDWMTLSSLYLEAINSTLTNAQQAC
jgi:glycosyltransferase involved in cell wall biosynthesis